MFVFRSFGYDLKGAVQTHKHQKRYVANQRPHERDHEGVLKYEPGAGSLRSHLSTVRNSLTCDSWSNVYSLILYDEVIESLQRIKMKH